MNIFIKSLSHDLIFSKLQAVVISDGLNAIPMRFGDLFDALANLPGLFGFRFGQNRILSFAFHKSGAAASVALANDGIAFPVADNDRRAFINAGAVGDASPAVVCAIAFTVFLPTTQVDMEIAALAFVLVDIEVNPFVADGNALLDGKAARDLFRAPILADQGIHGYVFCVKPAFIKA